MEQSLSSIIHLNVGGTRYSTSLETLVSTESTLQVMFSGTFSLLKDETGAIFIDRDGPSFRYILNYLRGSKLNAAALRATNRLEYDQLCEEADYFQLEGLKRLLNLGYTSFASKNTSTASTSSTTTTTTAAIATPMQTNNNALDASTGAKSVSNNSSSSSSSSNSSSSSSRNNDSNNGSNRNGTGNSLTLKLSPVSPVEHASITAWEIADITRVSLTENQLNQVVAKRDEFLRLAQENAKKGWGATSVSIHDLSLCPILIDILEDELRSLGFLEITQSSSNSQFPQLQARLPLSLASDDDIRRGIMSHLLRSFNPSCSDGYGSGLNVRDTKSLWA